MKRPWPRRTVYPLILGAAILVYLGLIHVPDRWFDLIWTIAMVLVLIGVVWAGVGYELARRRLAAAQRRRREAEAFWLDPPQD